MLVFYNDLGQSSPLTMAITAMVVGLLLIPPSFVPWLLTKRRRVRPDGPEAGGVQSTERPFTRKEPCSPVQIDIMSDREIRFYDMKKIKSPRPAPSPRTPTPRPPLYDR